MIRSAAAVERPPNWRVCQACGERIQGPHVSVHGKDPACDYFQDYCVCLCLPCSRLSQDPEIVRAVAAAEKWIGDVGIVARSDRERGKRP